MPAAGTHIFIADLILQKLNEAQVEDGQLKLSLLPVDGSEQPMQITLDPQLVAILQRNPASFRAGAISPDFFPDIFFGITISHQPELRHKTLAEYLSTFSKAIDFSNERQVAYCFGWLTHLCADIFGHHWVGMEAGGDFETWLSTDPEVIRKHIGIEMTWDKTLPTVSKYLAFERSLIQGAMLTPGSPLCEEYYNDYTYQPLHALITTARLGRWHGEQAAKIGQLRDRLQENDPTIIDFLKRSCPACTGLGTIQKLLPKECIVCHGVGTVSQIVQVNCPQCQALGVISENCPVCNAIGTIPQNCPICGGTGRIKCPACDGRGYKRKWGVKWPCPVCVPLLMPGGAPCPSHIISQTCPNCLGTIILKKTCPNCLGAKILEKTIQVSCPTCLGRKLIDVLQDLPCPVCLSGIAVRPLQLICDRLITYHRHRQEHVQQILDLYLEAHEKVAGCILNGQLGDILECYKPFWNEVKIFCTTQFSFTELIAPELQNVEEAVVKLVETALEDLKEMVIPDWIDELKEKILEDMTAKIAELLNLTLDEQEEQHYQEIFSQYQPDTFPPLANAVQLYLLALQTATPTAEGLCQAATILNQSNNIDKRCQPFLTRPFCDTTFPWNQYFYDFLDGHNSYAHCGATEHG